MKIADHRQDGRQPGDMHDHMAVENEAHGLTRGGRRCRTGLFKDFRWDGGRCASGGLDFGFAVVGGGGFKWIRRRGKEDERRIIHGVLYNRKLVLGNRKLVLYNRNRVLGNPKLVR